MSNCEQIRNIITISEQDRTAEEQAALQAHLASCPQCTQEENVYDAMDNLLSASLKEESRDINLRLVPPQNDRSIPAETTAGHNFSWLAVAASILLVVGAIASAYVIGTTRTELSHLRTQLSQAESRGSLLEKRLADKEKELTTLAKHVAYGPVRRVSYNIFTDKEPIDKPRKASMWLPGFPETQWKGNRHDLEPF